MPQKYIYLYFVLPVITGCKHSHEIQNYINPRRYTYIEHRVYYYSANLQYMRVENLLFTFNNFSSIRTIKILWKYIKLVLKYCMIL